MFNMLSASVNHEKPLRLTVNSDLKELAQKKGWLFEVIEKPVIQVHNPSNTIEENIIDIIRSWGSLLNNSFFASLKRHKIPKEKDFYRLYCVTSNEFPETFRCQIPYATVFKPNGLVITSDFEIVSQSVYSQSINLKLIQQNLNRSPVWPGSYVSLLSDYAALNYSHWLMDSLPKLSLLKSLNSDLRFIIPSNPPQYVVDSLILLGIEEKQIVKMREESMTVENLLLCRAAQTNGRPSKTHLLSVRNKLLSSIGNNNHSSYRRIYVSRSNSSRKISNESDILPILEQYNFEVLRCEEFSFLEQVRIFSETEAILGPHGAGIYNQIFCRPGARIIEIYNEQYWHHSSRIISSFMDHVHWHVFGKDAGKDWQTWIDPLKLEKILSLALM